jgi:hypothetical protein
LGTEAVTPVGQCPVPHFIAWIQPRLNMKPRADDTKSVPMQSAHAALSGVISLV